MLALLVLLAGQLPLQTTPEFIKARQGPAFGFEKGGQQIMPIGLAPGSTPERPLELLSNKQSVGLIPIEQLKTFARMNVWLINSQTKIREQTLANVRQPVLTNLHTHDHYNVQTTIKNQGGRGTCCVFGPTAAMEATYVRFGRGVLDLSEQYTNWLKNEIMIAHADDDLSLPQTNAAYYESLPGVDSAGLGCNGVMQMLTQYRTVTEDRLPYNGFPHYDDPSYNIECIRHGLGSFQWWVPTSATQRNVNDFNFCAEEQPARLYGENRYGIQHFLALQPSEFHNEETMEQVIDAGYDIVFSMVLYNPEPGTADPRDPVWRHPAGATPGGGHCMEIVGYDHDLRVFIVKNSWGYSAADPSMYRVAYTDLLRRFPGYVLLSYDCLPDFVEAGFITSVVAPTYNFAQRFIGKWDVTITQISRSRVVSQGTLYWRRLPGSMAFLYSSPDWRLGDYETSDGQNFRVNAYPVIGPPSTENVRMYINFASRGTNFHDLSGNLIAGSIEPYDTGVPTLTASIAPWGFARTVFGVPVSDLRFVARRHVEP